MTEEFRRRFNDYKLDTVVLKNYDDEMVRELFQRLQRGKPLNPAERLNAYPGTIVLAMRFIGRHEFFNLVNINLQRYRSYLLAARMILLQFGLEHFNAFPDVRRNGSPDRLVNEATETNVDAMTIIVAIIKRIPSRGAFPLRIMSWAVACELLNFSGEDFVASLVILV